MAVNAQAGMFFGATYNFQSSGAPRTPVLTAYQTGTNALWFAHCGTSGTNPYMDVWNTGCAVIAPNDLQNIDIKIDDGRPASGKLFGYGGSASPNSCTNFAGGVYTYNALLNTPQCMAVYIIN